MNSYTFSRCLGQFSSLARLGFAQFARQPLVRFGSNKCIKTVKSTCATKTNACGSDLATKMYEPPAVDEPPRVSMWRIKGCEPTHCEMNLRYDMKYYTISDKKKRKYQVTWNECPRLLIKPKKVCVYEKMVRPPRVKRPRSSLGSATKSCAKQLKKGGCVYIKAPCCKQGRRPPKCASGYPSLGNCEKKKTPYPSFSECKKDPLPEVPPIECKCLELPALCDAWAMFRRRIATGKKGYKSCGEP